MAVAIPCAGCTQPVRLKDLNCRSCGRQLTPGEREVLQARFEETNADYRDAKATVGRSLTVSLVAGLLTLVFASVRMLLLRHAGSTVIDPLSLGTALLDSIVGWVLVACFFFGKRAPAATLWVATGAAHIALVVPYFLAGPARAMLHFISPGNFALTLARVGALILLIQGLSAALVMKKLLSRASR
jgi:hypothetical protein